MPSEWMYVILGWALPLAVVVFLVTSVVRITRSLRSIESELTAIRQVLERNDRV